MKLQTKKTKTRPSITVLMTVYNGEQYIRTSIESVLNQVYRDFEFLIVDDCSTDRSFEIVESFRDDRIKVYRNKVNLGQTKSLNVGLKMAEGKYIARIDADDIAFPYWLERLFSFVEKNPGYSVVSANAIIIDQANRIKRMLKSCASYEEIILKSLTASPINHGGCMMNRDVILENLGYDENFRIAADYNLWSRLIRKGCRLTSVEDVVMAIRVHEQSASIFEKGKSDCRELSEIILENIHHLTDLSVKKEDGVLLWKLLYAVQSLSDEEFEHAKDLLKSIFENLKDSAGFKKPVIAKRLKRQLTVVYIKKAFFYIEHKNIKALRGLCRQYIKKNGFFNIFLVFFVCSLFNGIFIRNFPYLYEKLLKIRVGIKLKNKSFSREIAQTQAPIAL